MKSLHGSNTKELIENENTEKALRMIIVHTNSLYMRLTFLIATYELPTCALVIIINDMKVSSKRKKIIMLPHRH